MCLTLSFCFGQTDQLQDKICSLESGVGSVVLGYLLEAEMLKSTHLKTNSVYGMPKEKKIPEGSD